MNAHQDATPGDSDRSAHHVPAASTPDSPATEGDTAPTTTRGWRRRLPRGRTAVVAGATVAALTIGGAGFAAGHAVGDRGADRTTPTQQGPGFDRDGDGFGGPPDGQMGGQTDRGTDGTGGAPDFDGDGQPDDSTSDSGQDSTQQG